MFGDQGLFWPDEFYQTLEQAHRFAFGVGIVPWEFVSGARSWLYPGALGLLLKFASAVGVNSGLSLVILAKGTSVAMSIATVDLSMRIARRLTEDDAGLTGIAEILAGIFVGLFPPFLLFGSKCMTETVSGFLMVGATYLSLRPSGVTKGVGAFDRNERNRLVGAGVLTALAIFVRYQNGLFAVLLLLILLVQRRRQASMAFVAGALPIGILGGALDAWTWGTPFHSFVQYAQFHAENKAVAWGVANKVYFFVHTWRSGGPAVLFASLFFLLLRVRHLLLALVPIVYIGVHSMVPHKEYRFIVPVLPILFALSAAGIEQGLGRVQSLSTVRRAYVVAGILSVCVAFGFAERAIRMTFKDLGHGDGLAADLASGDDSPWHAAEGVNRLLAAAGDRSDVCGVAIKDIPWSSTGGYAYLHKDVPLYFDGEPETLLRANYFIARRDFHQSWLYKEEVESRGFMLFRREGACAEPPSDYTRLVPP